MDVGDDNYSCHPSRHNRREESYFPPISPTSSGRAVQGDQAEKGSLVLWTPGDQVSRKSEGQRTLKSQGDPFESIGDSRKRKANLEVYNTFIGHPKKCDPSYVKLKETGWAIV